MRKITDFIISKRYFILTLFIILTVICAILSNKVKINHDIAKYMPDDSETRIGMNIMEDEFSGTETSTLNLMFENLQDDEKEDVKNYLENLTGVKEIDYENTEEYNKDNYTLYVITVDEKADSQTASDVYNQITEKYSNYNIYTSGDVSENNKTVLPFWIIALAVGCALIILIVMCESYVEPFLFLTSILMAVILNKGTNIIFENVSHITDSITAILQMALSMDYSIMLMNRYDQEKETEKDNVKAMKNALYKAFQAISSSSVTTIVGLLALVFMSFKIGKDLGFVLAKGVLFSLICIFFVLPALILIFDKWITKTKKKSPNIKLSWLGKYSYKVRFIAFPLFLIIFVTSFILKGNLGIDYTDSKEDEISKIFSENNQIAIIYKNEDEEKISKYLKEFENEGKVKEVLGYGNTINEKLTYDKLDDKLEDLGSDVNIEDYLLKILYYDYYNKNENNAMTFSDFINFIEEEAYKNEKTNEKIDDETKKDITRLKNFVTESSINRKRTSSEIANILEIDENKVKDIFIYYLSKNNNVQLKLDEFVDFMNKDVLTNEEYSKKIDNESRNKLNTLSKFTNKQTVQSKMSSSQMAGLFGIDENTMNELYKYYILVNDIDIKLSISEFSDFVLNTVLNDSNYASSFDEATVQNIKLLSTFSDKNVITKQMNSKELSALFGIEDSKITQILLLKYTKQTANSKYDIKEFIDNAMTYGASYMDSTQLATLQGLSKTILPIIENKDIQMPLDENGLGQIFASINQDTLNSLFSFIKENKGEDYKMSPKEFVDFVLSIPTEAPGGSDSGMFNPEGMGDALKKLQFLKTIMSDKKFTSQEMTNLFQEIAGSQAISLEQINQLYVLIDYGTGNTNSWTSTPQEFVKLILDNSTLENIQSNIDENTINKLKLLSTIMESTMNDTTFTYQEISQVIGIDSEKTKSIYTLYVSLQNNMSLTPQEFVNFVLAHKDDASLAGRISNDTISDLNLLKTAIDGIVFDKKYNCEELSSLLNINKDDLKLLYGLYSSKYVNSNFTISLNEFINFLLKDVVTNPEYSSNFDNEQIANLNTVNGIMKNSIIGTKYTSNEIFGILSNLSDKVEKNTVEILYTYYGSSKEYNNSWELTIEEFVNYLNDDILKDERFTDFIDDDMRKDITDAKTTVADAKEMLIGNNYSRVVLNTKFAQESDETFAFVQKVKDLLGKNLNDFYVIGNSPMAYEMSKTFNNELNFMTIITMIFIFVVVVITFKSIIVPIILVLTIQCAVYLTMGILSFVGEDVYFISILIVQSILMGATIDYAILYTSYYLEHRKTEGIKESIIDSYNKSIHTILTSSSILIIVTLIIANFASAIAAKICKTISEGTLCSTILILTLLPAVLAFWDRFIVKDKSKFKS